MILGARYRSREGVRYPCAEAPARQLHQPLRAACGRPWLWASVFEFLQPNVIGDLGQLLDSHRAQIVAGVPPQGLVPRVSITVRQPSARSFESLDQLRNLVLRRQLEEQVDVVRDDPDFDNTRTVTLRFGEEEGREKIGDRFIDERQAGPGGPREVRIDANRHWVNLGFGLAGK